MVVGEAKHLEELAQSNLLFYLLSGSCGSASLGGAGNHRCSAHAAY